MKKNILALDLGKGSLGIAISRSGLFVSPLPNIHFHALDFEEALKLLLKQIEDETIDTIAIGYPTYPSGDPCEMTPLVERFIEKLKIHFTNKEIVKVDERNSTVEANDIMHENNKTVKKSKAQIDSIAASVILERYLKSLGQI